MKNFRKLETGDMGKPYERCLLRGPESLSDAELLAVILRTGSKGVTSVELASDILELSGKNEGLSGLCRLNVNELMEVPGIGPVKAVQIRCLAEMSKRIAVKNAKKTLSFNDPRTIAEYYYEQLRHEERELLICMMLDVHNNLICDTVVSKGTSTASLVSSREVFTDAIRYRAVSIILAHNHPSGAPNPSMEDDMVTVNIYEAGKVLDIGLLDHLVIGDRDYYSYRENGFFDN